MNLEAAPACPRTYSQGSHLWRCPALLTLQRPSGDRHRGVLALVPWEEEDEVGADGLDTASAVRSWFQAECHLLSPLVSSSVMNTCTKGHRNEIYIYNNHNYYSFTNFLFRGWSLAETTEQVKQKKKAESNGAPRTNKQQTSNQQMRPQPQRRKYLQNELGALRRLVCRFGQEVSPAQEGNRKEDLGLAPWGDGLAPQGEGAGAAEHPPMIYGSGMSPDKKHRLLPCSPVPQRGCILGEIR